MNWHNVAIFVAGMVTMLAILMIHMIVGTIRERGIHEAAFLICILIIVLSLTALFVGGAI